jgi:leucyl aminopeptidase
VGRVGAVPDPELLNPVTSEWSVEDRPLADVLADHDAGDLALAVAVGAAGFNASGAEALELVGLDATAVRATWEPPATAGAVTAVPLPPGERAARTVLLVGVGTGSADDLRSAGAALGRAVRGRSALVTGIGSGEAAAVQSALAEGLALGGYASPRWLSDRTTPAPAPVGVVALVGSYDGDVVRHSVRRATATMLARNLAVVPSNTKNPAWVAAQARTLGRRHGLDVTVWNERELRAGGFGGLLAVGAASATPPRLVRLDWTPEGAGARTPHVVLVGKGITFDTGGLDVKPAEGMLAMKTDMSGAGIVLAVLAAATWPSPCGSPGCWRSRRTPWAPRPTGPGTSSPTTGAAPSRSATPMPRGGS